MNMNDTIKISTSERVTFCGATGSGKTVLAKTFLMPIQRVIVIDPKHTFDLPDFTVRFDLPRFNQDKIRQIWRPMKQDDERMVSILERIYRKGNMTIYVDEMTSLSERFPMTTEFLEEIARTGREKRISLWSAMQRPRWSPKIFLTESEVFFVFTMRAIEDRKYLAGFIGDSAEARIPKYNFWYQRTDLDSDPALLTYNMKDRKIVKVRGGDTQND
jgi:ABC-type dipeptide/oligopeptide/nickel transport system ATPase component